MRKWAGRKGGRLKRECVGDWLTGGDKKGGMDDERNRGCGLALAGFRTCGRGTWCRDSAVSPT